MSLEQAHPVLGRHPIGVICDVTSGEQLMSQGLRKVPGEPGMQGAKFLALALCRKVIICVFSCSAQRP